MSWDGWAWLALAVLGWGLLLVGLGCAVWRSWRDLRQARNRRGGRRDV